MEQPTRNSQLDSIKNLVKLVREINSTDFQNIEINGNIITLNLSVPQRLKLEAEVMDYVETTSVMIKLLNTHKSHLANDIDFAFTMYGFHFLVKRL